MRRDEESRVHTCQWHGIWYYCRRSSHTPGPRSRMDWRRSSNAISRSSRQSGEECALWKPQKEKGNKKKQKKHRFFEVHNELELQGVHSFLWRTTKVLFFLCCLVILAYYILELKWGMDSFSQFSSSSTLARKEETKMGEAKMTKRKGGRRNMRRIKLSKQKTHALLITVFPL